MILTAMVQLASGSQLVIIGDSLQKMSNVLGTPDLEYALNGQMIHQYTECSVITSNQVVISVEYHIPTGVPQEEEAVDTSPTIDEIKALALQNDAEAQYLLAYSYQFGQFVDQSYKKAINWYTKSAKQGYMPAQHNLGFLYMNGKGVERDLEQAYVWALLAADNGNNTLKNAIEHRISDEQKTAALQHAQEVRVLIQSEELTRMQNL